MRRLGVWRIVFAIGSARLPMIGMQFTLLAWIGLCGPTVAWIIRGAMVVAGPGLVGAETVAAKRGAMGSGGIHRRGRGDMGRLRAIAIGCRASGESPRPT